MKKAIVWTTMFVLVLYSGVFAQGIGSAFTYQGRLNDGGSAASGQYDLEFKLFDDPNIPTGMQIGSAITHEDLNIYDGHFTVTLDFGSLAFNGDPRYLEIGVRPPASTGAFTTLSPRKLVAPAP
ncbi:MAG: hypothetical protein GY869_30900, partial [Planctomycetes bacterium]|nr:hypothetical protein [Planctomycetota bacterium]